MECYFGVRFEHAGIGIQTMRRYLSDPLLLVARMLVIMPGATSSFLLLVVIPFAPSSIRAPSSDDICSYYLFAEPVVPIYDRVAVALGGLDGAAARGDTVQPGGETA